MSSINSIRHTDPVIILLVFLTMIYCLSHIRLSSTDFIYTSSANYDYIIQVQTDSAFPVTYNLNISDLSSSALTCSVKKQIKTAFTVTQVNITLFCA